MQWALPQLGLYWPGFRRVHKQVCKRLKRRLAELELPHFLAYRRRLEEDREEWRELDLRCRVTISRFYRDRAVFIALARVVLPHLARSATATGQSILRAWSIGCASGEEVYSLRLTWHGMDEGTKAGQALWVLGTDIDPVLLARAQRACYPEGSLQELPPEWRRQAFRKGGAQCCLHPRYREGTEFRCQDVRQSQSQGPFDLILCRNLVFTYYQPEHQRRVLGRIQGVLREGGALVIGASEELPSVATGLSPWPRGPRCIFRQELPRPWTKYNPPAPP